MRDQDLLHSFCAWQRRQILAHSQQMPPAESGAWRKLSPWLACTAQHILSSIQSVQTRIYWIAQRGPQQRGRRCVSDQTTACVVTPKLASDDSRMSSLDHRKSLYVGHCHVVSWQGRNLTSPTHLTPSKVRKPMFQQVIPFWFGSLEKSEHRNPTQHHQPYVSRQIWPFAGLFRFLKFFYRDMYHIRDIPYFIPRRIYAEFFNIFHTLAEVCWFSWDQHTYEWHYIFWYQTKDALRTSIL